MTTERDAELSALLDGALAAREERALRAELARDPVLAARLAELAQVDAVLRALPARPVPADLRARLHAKLAAEALPRASHGVIRGGAPARPNRRRAWFAGASAAVAAAAAALVVVLAGPSGQPAEDAGAKAPLVATTPRAASPLGSDIALAASGSEASAPTDERNTLVPQPETALAGAASGSPDPSRVASAAEPAPSPERPAADVFVGEPEAEAAGEASRALDPSALALAPSPGASPTPSTLGTAASSPPAPQVAVAPAAELLVEMSDSEAAALGELEPNDVGIVAVLDFLGALDALEAEAS